MKTQYSPPYYAHQSCHVWYVVNSEGGYELEVDSRELAVVIAEAMTRMAESMNEE